MKEYTQTVHEYGPRIHELGNSCIRGPYSWTVCIVTILLLSACSSPTPPQPPTVLPTAPPTATSTPAATPIPPTSTPTSTSTQPAPTETPGLRVCSPLAEVTLSEIPGLIAGNTYQTPMPGRDSGHPGIDLAFYTHGSRKGILGLPALAALAGKVAAVIPDRYPYGNAVIIEVPLDSIPAAWSAAPSWPTQAPTVIPDPRLTCPSPLSLPQWDASRRSLYLLYGHLEQPSPLRVGDAVTCGQAVGAVGTSGASVNPHLHFEARLGPSGASIDSMGHYDPHTTAEERNNYCLWRVSSWFQVIDPLLILRQQP